MARRNSGKVLTTALTRHNFEKILSYMLKE
jgi:hypothetical protein